MTAFETFEAGVEVNGQTVLAFVEGTPDAFEATALEILGDNGIEDPQPEEWYSQQAWLDAFADIAEDIGSATLTSIGKSIPESAEWPPDVETVPEGIESIDEAYHMNHRGGKIGHYEVEQVKNSEATVRCTNPYACAFDQGIIEATAAEFADRGRPTVEETGNECRSTGGEQCTYRVEW